MSDINEYILKCPTTGCKGNLKFSVLFTTDMNYSDYDQNSNTETWYCSSCRRTFSRSFKWQEARKLDRTEPWREKKADK